MIVKTHMNRDGRILIAVIDSSLFGKKFEEGTTQLDLSADFYNGKEMPTEEAGDLVRNADMVNMVGEEAITLGIQEGVIDPAHVKKIQGIPFAQGTRE